MPLEYPQGFVPAGFIVVRHFALLSAGFAHHDEIFLDVAKR
jgi:hypothetical protein